MTSFAQKTCFLDSDTVILKVEFRYGIVLWYVVAFQSIFKKGEFIMTTMTFGNTTMQYRIALDTTTQMFMAYDQTDTTRIGYGVTIEQAVAALQKIS